MTESLTIGERVAWYRRRRGMSQEVLSGLVGRTEDWLQKAENNRIQLDRLSLIRGLAEALDVSVGDLLGEPTLLEWTAESSVQTVPALRAALMDYSQLSPVLFTGHVDREPVAVQTLQRQVAEIFAAYQGSRFGYVTARLPELLKNAIAASRTYDGPDLQAVRVQLALCYQAAASVLSKLGEADLAWVAAERGLREAEVAGDPVILGSLLRSVAHSLLATGQFVPAVQLVERASEVLRPELSTADGRLLSVYGSLFLAGAMAASRNEDRATTRTFLNEAQHAADRQGSDANHLWTAFGPTNVAIHRVNTAMELGDVQLALDLGPEIDTSALPTERQVRHALDLARAYSLRNRADDALAVVLDAERIAPEQVRHHYISRQLVLTWMRNQRSQPSSLLTGLVDRMKLS
ncbi:helix-turn-helix transcriptional regulator [Lentzea tibetensis]|uniref:Helix-turn-helix transcriptional regulator n=1 Tax=Lentzea tibetensis TaxID=2591470 RepID=A0A563F0E4_9PSEU|nr:helix-turn-helix transcriptional regulator [Lentzea tibetensis]TWP53221.1 helix-turn-helix transcriptional regulator [Lentzea tibetensis]